MIESKELITGEVQGTSEPKFVVLTDSCEKVSACN